MNDIDDGARFALGRALGFWWRVLKARPAGFLAASLYQAVLTSAATLAFLALSAGPSIAYTEALMAAGGEMSPAVFALMMDQQRALWTGFALTLIAFALSEAAWLRLFAKGQARLLPTGGDELRVFALLLIGFGGALAIIIVGLLVAGVLGGLAGAVGGAAIGGLVGALVFIAALVLCVWFAVCISPAAALSVARGRFAIGAAFSGSGKIFWPLLGALFVALLIYIAVAIVLTAVSAALPGPTGEIIRASFDLPAAMNDPSLQYRAIAAAIAEPGGVLALWAGYAVLTLLYAPVMALWRGVGTRAALDFDAEP